MGTMSKLDPNIRRARQRRAVAAAHVAGMGRAWADPKSQFRVSSLAATLEEVRKDPRFTAEEKDAKFKAILNRSR